MTDMRGRIERAARALRAKRAPEPSSEPWQTPEERGDAMLHALMQVWNGLRESDAAERDDYPTDADVEVITIDGRVLPPEEWEDDCHLDAWVVDHRTRYVLCDLRAYLVLELVLVASERAAEAEGAG